MDPLLLVQNCVVLLIGRDPSDFEGRIQFLLENENREYIPEDWVPSSTYCLVSDDKRVIGAVNIRHSFREAAMS